MTDHRSGEGATPESEVVETAETLPVSGEGGSEPATTVEQVPADQLAGAIEAILMVVSEPVTPAALAKVLGHSPKRVHECLLALQRDYERGHSASTAAEAADSDPSAPTPAPRGFELREAAGGWRIYSRPAYAPWVGKFVVRAESAKLTQAALETLAIVAYRQPVTRAKIAEIRGVGVDSVMRTLLARELVEEAGTTLTGAYLYRTTPLFLEKMGFNSLDDLLPLAPFLPPREAIDELSAELEENRGR